MVRPLYLANLSCCKANSKNRSVAVESVIVIAGQRTADLLSTHVLTTLPQLNTSGSPELLDVCRLQTDGQTHGNGPIETREKTAITMVTGENWTSIIPRDMRNLLFDKSQDLFLRGLF